MSQRTSVLGVPVDVLSAAELRERSFLLMSSHRAHQAMTVNALMVLAAEADSELMRACSSASLMLPESAGLRWALKRKGMAAGFLAGIDFAWQLCELAAENGWPVFLLGGSEEALRGATERLKNDIPRLQVIGSHNGFFDSSVEREILTSIKSLRPRLVLVALGMPKQDLWIARQLPELSPGLYMGVGGSFDVWAGRLKRAPQWIQRAGLEWFYRLCQEPWRWARMAALPKFVWKVLGQTS